MKCCGNIYVHKPKWQLHFSLGSLPVVEFQANEVATPQSLLVGLQLRAIASTVSIATLVEIYFFSFLCLRSMGLMYVSKVEHSRGGG